MAHAVVVGAGVFGVWSAHHLQAAGHRVTLIDAYGPANSRSSSGDESRIVRCGYGADEIYTLFAQRSLSLWRTFAARHDAHAPLFHSCGVLWLASGDDPYSLATERALTHSGHQPRVLDRGQLQARFPQLASEGLSRALLEEDAGVVMARRSVQTLAAAVAAAGARGIQGRVAPLSEPAARTLRAVPLVDGGEVEGDLFVFACGAWLPTVFPALLTGIIRPTRQVVAYFGTPPGDERFGPQQMAAWVDFPSGIYGVPDLEGRGLKVGIDRHGPPFDPDSGERVADGESIATMRAWLRRRLPDLAAAPVLETRVCQYENTATGDFLVDRHPHYDNVIIAGGGSGHGFKHGPAIGEYVAALLTAGLPPEPRFSLAAKTSASARAVY